MAKVDQTEKHRSIISGLVLATIPAALAIYLLSLMPAIKSGERLRVTFDWVPSLGVSLDFWADGLSLTFGLIITLVGAVVTVYASGYLAGDPLLKRFYAYLMLFMLAMLGVVFSANLMALFVFWELTSLSSYLLIGFYHDKADSREAARQALLVTGIGGLLMLAGLVLLGQLGGSYDLAQLLSWDGWAGTPQPLFSAALILILLGAFTKSAQFPFHFWLPGAMAAPAPVSAYLHSATMVK
ncbi:MAG: hypothetical protein JW862_06065, partial [Anaerolineales bacterium]|nr:hypothetical protein [Anaerolineales bacterium]